MGNEYYQAGAAVGSLVLAITGVALLVTGLGRILRRLRATTPTAAPVSVAGTGSGIGSVLPNAAIRRSGPETRALVVPVLLAALGGLLVVHGALTVPDQIGAVLNPSGDVAAKPLTQGRGATPINRAQRSYRLALPAVAGPWRQVKAVGRFRAVEEGFRSAPDGEIGATKVALYSTAALPTVVLVVAHHHMTTATYRNYWHELQNGLLDYGGLFVVKAAHDRGAPGQMRCGKFSTTDSTQLVPVCAWLDPGTLGMVFAFPQARVSAQAATQTLRAAAERVVPAKKASA